MSSFLSRIFLTITLFSGVAFAATNINPVQWTLEEYNRIVLTPGPKEFASFKPPKDDPKKPVDDAKRRPGERMGLAWQAYQAGEYEKALLQLKKILSDAPKSPEVVSAEMLSGYAVARLGQPSQAATSFARVTNQFKNHALAKPATYALAVLAIGDKRFSEALPLLPKLAAPKGDLTPKVMLALGQAHQGMKNDAMAISNLDAYLKQYPKTNETHKVFFRLAQIYRGIGNLASAKSNYGLVMSQYIDSELRLLTLKELVSIALQEKNRTLAITTSQQILKEFAASVRIDEDRFALGKMFYEDGKKAEAAGYFEPLLRDPYLKSPLRQETLIQLTRISKELGDRVKLKQWGAMMIKELPTHALTKEILPDLLRFSYLDKEYALCANYADVVMANTSFDNDSRRDAAIYLILIYEMRAPDTNKALAAYQSYFKLNPPAGFERLSYMRDYNKLLEKLNRKDLLRDSVQNLFDQTRLPAERSALAFQLAGLYEPSDKTKALQYFELAASLQPASRNAIPAMQAAARLQAELGQAAKADLVVAKIIRNYPDKEPAPAAYLALAQAFEKSGNKSEAVRNYKRVSDGFPASSEARSAADSLKRLQ